MAALLLLGTATAQGDGQYLFLRTPKAAITARVNEDSVSGPDVQLNRDGKTVRGRAFGQTVFLGLNGQELGGTVGSELTRMSFEDKGGTTRARGTFYGRLAELNLSPESLTGTVGRCGYDLKATQEGSYVGSRSCGGSPERPVTLEIPPALAKQGTAMTLATLALILGTP
ncbi:hypothetical protein [Vitiosangium sp. GDMCC 1.1324]|uniref:hypothetical protein n=1 Tax=Vitiosangium sp. (strain GDMCC 1.1324) TaxID=2138576 RepID=UPI000D3D442C|nr:hypothetical protein [Vitiosangium sp. GDMCC 1.1324]PTL84503.1 hypothetical protein DAT35_05285 [Vitiosangium sp. GDMCC 1.1324]